MALVDSRIRVWWTEEKAWYAGRVVSSGRGLHTIAYDDDHSLTHDLLKVTWEAEPGRKRKAEAKAEAPKKRAKKQPARPRGSRLLLHPSKLRRHRRRRPR